MTDLITIQPPGKAGQAIQIVAKGDPPALIQNPGPNTVYVGDTPGIQPTDPNGVVPLNTGGSVNTDGSSDLYATIPAGLTQTLYLISGATNFFSPPSLIGLGGVKVFVQPTAPAPPPAIPVNSLWLNTTLGALESWNGATWVLQAFTGTELITAGTIAANLLIANFFVGYEIDGAIFRAKNSFGATIMTINKSAGTWILYQDTGSATQGMVTASGNNSLNTTTDEFLNEILPGMTAYGGSTTIWSAVNMTGASTNGQLAYYSSTAATQTGFTLQTQISFATGGVTVLGNGGFGFTLDNTDNLTIGLAELFREVAIPAATAGFATLFATAGGTMGQVTSAGFAGDLSMCQKTPVNVHTVTGTVDASLADCTIYTANDPEDGSCYEMEVWGSATQGSTVQVLNLSLNLGGITTDTVSFGAAQWSVSQALRWHARLIIKCVSAASGTWFTCLVGEVSEAGNAFSPGTSGQSTIGFTTSNIATIVASTGAATTLKLQAHWTANTGAPTISGTTGNVKKVA